MFDTFAFENNLNFALKYLLQRKFTSKSPAADPAYLADSGDNKLRRKNSICRTANERAMRS